MKKLISFLTVFIAVLSSYAVHVPVDQAKQVATTYLKQHLPSSDLVVKDVITMQENGLSTLYIFLFNPSGYVIVSADDAVIPILGYSEEGTIPQQIENPALSFWLENYSQEIAKVVTSGLSNRTTKEDWQKIGKGTLKSSPKDVQPLLTTNWDQGCFYNTLCPSDGGGQCGHVWTGCVATAMSQIMKYHNYPPQGVGSHTYTHPQYGVQTANFGTTTYDWASMPNGVFSSNPAVATIMYHAGVSVDMQYGTSGSGAYSDDVPYALLNYFNYKPGVEIVYKNSYSNVEDFKNLIRQDLDEQLPLYYSGSGSGGHAFVCDGYRLSDDKFHFNWGWSGSSNGWYAIGALNPGGSNFNSDNAIVRQIIPYNSNLIVRISHPVDNAVIGVGYAVDIQGVTVRGVPSMMKIFIDGVEKFSTDNDTIDFVWQTSAADLGSHDVKVFSYSPSDTVFYKINLNVAEWISQASAFPTVNRGISYMSAVDSMVVWAVGMDNGNPTGACSDFTRTTDGGTTWVPGTIPNTAGLAGSMIFGVSELKAYVPMYKVSGSKPQGIYYTNDGGVTWTRQTTASFSNSASFPNCVHFFNENEGWCMGDPINGEYEIYTTADGGTTWTAVNGSNIPNPTSGEFGVVGYYSAVNDTLWFGTNKGRVYRSIDKGLTWTVSTVTALNGKYIKPTFRNGSHGLVQDKDAGTTGAICESFDGGVTWSPVAATGTIYATDLSYVPGTSNTWVSSGSTGSMGASYSFDGGHNWVDFAGTSGAAYMQMTWVNNHCGWAGGVNSSATENGVYKFIGVLMVPLPAPINVNANVVSHDVTLTWEAPTVQPGSGLQLMGYNVYRDGTKLNSTVLTGTTYVDAIVVSGVHEYCVTAVFSVGESVGSCVIVDVAVGIAETSIASISIYPNPVSDVSNVTSNVHIFEATLFDVSGRIILRKDNPGMSFQIDVTTIPQGIYSLRLKTMFGNDMKKVVVKR